jgi:hypothetical protein
MRKYYTESRRTGQDRRKANWTGHTLCRECPLKHIIQGKIEEMIEVMEKRGR